MARPDKFPEWARLPYVDPVVGGNNIVEPPSQQKNTGYLRKQKPPAQYTNYLFNKINEWLEYLNGEAGSLPKNYTSGMLLSNNSSDPQHDIDCETGEWRSSDNTTDLILTATMIKKIDVDWAEGTNQGGFPSGLAIAANTKYHYFAIGKPDGTTDTGYDSDINASNLLSDATDYTKFVRIGSVFTDGSIDIIPFTMTILTTGQRQVYWKDILTDYTQLNPGIAAVPVAMRVPLDVKTDVIFVAVLHASGLASTCLFTSLDQTDIAPTTTLYDMDATNVKVGQGRFRILSDTASQIRFRLAVSSGVTVSLNTIGWIE